MAADVANPLNVGGFKNPSLEDPTKNCTAQDVKIATAEVLQYSFTGDIGDFTDFDPLNPPSCIEGDPIFLKIKAKVEEGAQSARTDIGFWIAQDGGNARTGLCNHYNLAPVPTWGGVLDGVSNAEKDPPGDQCGDMNAGGKTDLELGTIDAICKTASNGTLLHIGSCIGWTEPGGDVVCPQPGIDGSNGFRFGTTPGNSSKCNCEGFDVPIVVKKVAHLEVKKVCDPTDDGGTFDLLIDGSTSVGTPPVVVGDNKACGGTTGSQELDAGTTAAPGKVHTHGEGDFTTTDYTSSFSCVNRVGGASRGTGSSLGPNNITLQPNDDVVCTYTNVRKPRLTIVKRVKNDNGGTATVGAFGVNSSAGSLTFDGGADDGASVKKFTSQTFTLEDGPYTLRENDVTGYDEGTWSCTDGNLTNNTIGSGSVTLGAGDNAVCTITNDDQGASLKVKKIIVNDQGGTKTVGDFGLRIDGNLATFPTGSCNTVGNTTTCLSDGVAVTPGTHTFVELNVAGYTEGDWSCSPKSAETVAFDGGSVVTALGDNITCTITNNDDPGSLIVKKIIESDNGGTKTVGDFGLKIDGNAAAFPAGSCSTVGTTTTCTSSAVTVNAGNHTMTELNVTGYTEGTWSCTPTAATSNTFNGGSVAVANGQTVTCQITNTDDPASLRVKKIITNDNGGTKTVGDFALKIDGNAAAFPAGSCSTVGTTTTCLSSVVSVNAGNHTFTEANVTGYTEGTWTCSPTAATTNTFDGGSVPVALGDAITCEITNTDDPGSLKVKKIIINDHGGTKTVGDFGLKIDGNAAAFPAGSCSTVGTTTTCTSSAVTVNAGNHTMTELNVTGYTEGTWSCTPTAASKTTFNDGAVPVGNGVDVTCEITNDDDPATLIIVKSVKGASTTFPFSSTKSAIGSFNLTPLADNSASKTFNGLSAGTYDVTEAVPGGYVLTDLGCSNDDPTTPYDPKATQTVNAVLANGATVTCTFVNEGQTSQTTRTQGFWATHNGVKNGDGTNGLTYIVWFGGSFNGVTYGGVTNKYLCVAKPIDTLGKLLGGFWSDISKTSTGKKRSDLDQARMQLAQQLLAAILNNAAFGSSPTKMTIDQAKAAYCGNDIGKIKDAQSAMASFNTSGDNGTFTPGQSANGKLSKTLALYSFWDALP